VCPTAVYRWGRDPDHKYKGMCPGSIAHVHVGLCGVLLGAGRSWVLLSDVRALLGAIWVLLGILGAARCCLGTTWAFLGAVRCAVRCCLEPLWSTLAFMGAVGCCWARWVLLSAVGCCIGCLLGVWCCCGHCWAFLGAVERCWVQLGAVGTVGSVEVAVYELFSHTIMHPQQAEPWERTATCVVQPSPLQCPSVQPTAPPQCPSSPCAHRIGRG